MSTALAPGLARKVKKILETRTESAEILGSLGTLSSFYEGNTPFARRRLRATIEKRGLSINEEFLQAAESVVKALDVIQADLEGLTTGCAKINEAVSASRSSTSEMLVETEKLQRDLAVSTGRSQMVEKFLRQYQLTAEEIDALQAEQIGESFFGALERVRAIHANCRNLLRTHHQRAGLELMDAMSNYQETAYERLCRWVREECRGLGDLDAPEVGPLLQRAARALRDRQVLFKYCAEEVATARHSALFQRFIAALTRGGPGGTPRPIEMHAHDPRRYIGDMLAWVHQSLASERELLISLFGEDGLDREGSGGAAGGQSFSGEPGDMPNTAVLLDKVFESICRPLKVRVEQVLMASPPLLLCFKLAQLLGFYTATVEQLLGSDAQLTASLAGCQHMAARVFQEQLKGRGDKLLRYPPAPGKNLAPPQQLLDGVHVLMEIVGAYESAYASGADSASEEEFAPVLAAAIDPLLEMCERSAEGLSADAPSRVDEDSRLDPGAQRIFLINCLASLQGPLRAHSCCASRAAQVGDILEGHIAGLVGGEVGTILGKCGLAEIVERARLYKAGRLSEGAVMAADPALPTERLTSALKSFFSTLSKPDALPEMGALQVPRVRADITTRIAQSLANSYELVYSAFTDPQNGYTADSSAGDAVLHTPGHVRTILGLSEN